MQLKLQKFLWYSLIFFSIFDRVESLKAQHVGGAIFPGNTDRFAVSVDAGHFTKKIFGIKNDSRRFFLRGSYGIGDRLDFFGRVGLIRLKLTLSDSARTVLDDGFRVAYGGGLTLRILDLERLNASLFLSGQAFRVISKPDFEESLSYAGNLATQVLQLEYDWREANFTFGLTKRFKSVHFYTGVNAKIIQRFETKIDKLVFSGQSALENRENGKYNSGTLISPLVGVGFNLPSRLKFSLELAANNETDFSFYVSLSQTGKL